jgi:hypothetical protein
MTLFDIQRVVHENVRACRHSYGLQLTTNTHEVGGHEVFAVTRTKVRLVDGGWEPMPTTTWYLDGKRRGLGEVRRIVEGRMQ